MTALRLHYTFKILNLLSDRDELELDGVVSKLAGFAILALALGHDIWAHLGLARLERDASTLVVKQILLNTIFAELLRKLRDLFQTFNVLLHLFDVAMPLELASLAFEIEVLDAAVKEHILIVCLVIERTHFVDEQANCSQSGARAQLTLSQVLIRNVIRVLLPEVGTLWQLEAVIKAQQRLPSSLDRLLPLLVKSALSGHNSSSTSNLVLGILFTAIEKQH